MRTARAFGDLESRAFRQEAARGTVYRGGFRGPRRAGYLKYPPYDGAALCRRATFTFPCFSSKRWSYSPCLVEACSLTAPWERVAMRKHFSEASSSATLIGIDRDCRALASARERLARFGPRLAWYEARFSELREVVQRAAVDRVAGVLADLGVSSDAARSRGAWILVSTGRAARHADGRGSLTASGDRQFVLGGRFD